MIGTFRTAVDIQRHNPIHHGRSSAGSATGGAPKVLVAAAILLISGAFGCTQAKKGIRVVLITIDTVRFDSLAGGPAGDSTMPHLRSWSDDSTNFVRFWSATSSTQPSHASMFTGLHPWEHGVTGNAMLLEDHHATLVELLHDAGFETSAVVASVPVSRRFGFSQGFDRFHDDFDMGRLRGEFRRLAEENPESKTNQEQTSFYSLATSISQRALEEIERSTSDRQFFWFHYFDPHAPYGDVQDGPTLRPGQILKKAGAGKNLDADVKNAKELYDLDVAHLDKELSRVLERLENESDFYDTHIVIVADHGESFGEEGSLSHGRRLSPSMIHVPCIIRSSRCAAGVRSDIASSIDVAHTLLAMSDVADGGEFGMPSSGRDLTGPPDPSASASGMRRTYREPFHERRLDGSVHVLSDFRFFHLSPEGVLVRGNRTAITHPPEWTPSETEIEDMKNRFATFEDSVALTQAASIEDEKTKEALRALGYVQ